MLQTDHKNFMKIALDLARLGLGRTSPNPAVGAVIVSRRRVIATGLHKGAGLPHAEVEAIGKIRPVIRSDRMIRRSSVRSDDRTTLYVTLEPCCHFGRTPPCTDRILESGIREVVIGMRDPDPKVSGRGIRILKRNGIQVREGVLRRECEHLNEAYIKHRTTGMPFVQLKMAMSLDGKVATRSGRPRWITGPESRTLVHRMRDTSDAILVGVNTVIRDNPRLTTRLGRSRGHDPVRVILDSRLRIPRGARVLRLRSKSPTILATTVKGRVLRGAEILPCRPDKTGRVDLRDLLKKLGQRGIVSLMVEGGATVFESFVTQKLADKWTLFLAPVFIGDKGLSFGSTFRMRPTSCRLVGPDLMLEGDFPIFL